MRTATPWLALLLLTACPSATLLPDEERVRITRDYEGKTVYLRQSVFVMPFFSDADRHLVSVYPPDSVHLLNDTEGKPILPGPSEGVLQLGTQVHLDKVEFPTGFVVTKRPVYSPRENPWVYLSVVGAKKSKPLVAVLRPKIKTREEFTAAMDLLFSDENPEVWLKKYPPEIRDAIKAKKLVSGMDPDAVKMAWGPPERVHSDYVDMGGPAKVKVETWTWPLNKRTATLRDDRLAEATPPLAP